MTGLPKHLTDAVKSLRQLHQANLVADATLYDLRPDLKAEILIAHAKALPVEQRARMVTALTDRPSSGYRVEDKDGEVIGEIPQITGKTFNYVHADGVTQRLRYIDHYPEHGPGAKYHGVLVVEVLVD